jgi:hypothetical protein
LKMYISDNFIIRFLNQRHHPQWVVSEPVESGFDGRGQFKPPPGLPR